MTTRTDKLGRRRAPDQERGLVPAEPARAGRTSRSHNVNCTPAAHAWFASLTPQERGDVIERARNTIDPPRQTS